MFGRFLAHIGIGRNELTGRKIGAIYTLGFVYTFVWAFPLYINSSLLERFMSERAVGIVFTLAALASLFFLGKIPALLRRYGHYRITLIFLGVQLMSLLALALLSTLSIPLTTSLVVIAFIALDVSITLVFFGFDILLEQLSTDKTTGAIRGYFLTLTNAATIVAPFAAGLLLTDGDFWKIYGAAGLLIILMLFLVTAQFKSHPNPDYHNISFKTAIRRLTKDKNLYGILRAYFLLFVFYVWMVVYIPIYLHNYIGLSYSVIIGMVIPIALIPFPLFQMFLGQIADKYWGEKELLIVGFLIAGLGVIAFPFITSTQWWVWAIALFITRIGASFIELMSESYFYKHVESRDVSLVSCFRMLRPLSYVFGTMVATACLWILPEFKYLFFVLGFILLWGIYYARDIADTR